MARALGRRGGNARSRRLSSIEKKRIASMGAQARVRSLQVARRVAANFGYAAAVRTLRGTSSRVERRRHVDGRLPGLYRGPS